MEMCYESYLRLLARLGGDRYNNRMPMQCLRLFQLSLREHETQIAIEGADKCVLLIVSFPAVLLIQYYLL